MVGVVVRLVRVMKLLTRFNYPKLHFIFRSQTKQFVCSQSSRRYTQYLALLNSHKKLVIFYTLDKGSLKLKAAMELSRKRGKKTDSETTRMPVNDEFDED